MRLDLLKSTETRRVVEDHENHQVSNCLRGYHQQRRDKWLILEQSLDLLIKTTGSVLEDGRLVGRQVTKRNSLPLARIGYIRMETQLIGSSTNSTLIRGKILFSR